jgi:hypothetical protein
MPVLRFERFFAGAQNDNVVFCRKTLDLRIVTGARHMRLYKTGKTTHPREINQGFLASNRRMAFRGPLPIHAASKLAQNKAAASRRTPNNTAATTKFAKRRET